MNRHALPLLWATATVHVTRVMGREGKRQWQFTRVGLIGTMIKNQSPASRERIDYCFKIPISVHLWRADSRMVAFVGLSLFSNYLVQSISRHGRSFFGRSVTIQLRSALGQSFWTIIGWRILEVRQLDFDGRHSLHYRTPESQQFLLPALRANPTIVVQCGHQRTISVALWAYWRVGRSVLHFHLVNECPKSLDYSDGETSEFQL
jgi:hypothetical protein